jgi:hypothetical protein
MRKTPVYILSKDLGSWMAEHNDVIFEEILESTEAALAGEYELTAIPVIILQSESGTSLFMLKSKESAEESLEKALNYYVGIEAYEKAARARDIKKAVASTDI